MTRKTQSVFVPDTSTIIEGFITSLIEKGEIKGKLIIHKAVLAELEHQANFGREIGEMGLEEIKKIRERCEKKKIKLEFNGARPSITQIRNAKSGEVDAMIRDLAWQENATLITADKVQAKVSEAIGIKTILLEMPVKKAKKPKISKYFTEGVMSAHIKEEVPVFVKQGTPGNWVFKQATKKPLTKEEVKEIAEDIFEQVNLHKDSFVEINRKNSSIIQLEDYRIIISRPPLSNGYEITAVKPLKKMELKDYNLDKEVLERIKKKATGLLIAGRPGAGKTTFAEALAKNYLEQNKVVKTIEAPRDLQLPPSITQYSKNAASDGELHDIFLLSRPDYVIFDEMRTTKDFRIFTDLRLAGIGLAGVIHGTTPIDSIQRFIGKIDVGMLSSVIDTVIFIEAGRVNKVYSLDIKVKIPTGMSDDDLARPVVEVRDFKTKKLEYEIYTFGEENVVIPISEETSQTKELAKQAIKNALKKHVNVAEVQVDLLNDRRALLRVNKELAPKIIGKQGNIIKNLEKKLGISIDVRGEETGKESIHKKSTPYKVNETRNNIVFKLGKKFKNVSVDVYLGDEFFFTITTNKKSEIKINKNTDVGKRLLNALNENKKVTLKA